MMIDDTVVELDEYRNVEDIVKRRLGGVNVVFCVQFENGDIGTFVPSELEDITLVYMIQTLKDRRQMRVNEVNS
jgi:hypothetical protein